MWRRECSNLHQQKTTWHTKASSIANLIVHFLHWKKDFWGAVEPALLLISIGFSWQSASIRLQVKYVPHPDILIVSSRSYISLILLLWVTFFKVTYIRITSTPWSQHIYYKRFFLSFALNSNSVLDYVVTWRALGFTSRVNSTINYALTKPCAIDIASFCIISFMVRLYLVSMVSN